MGLTVIVEVTVPSACSVMLVGDIDAGTFPVTVSTMVSANPPSEVAVMVELPDWPWVTFMAEGLVERVNPGTFMVRAASCVNTPLTPLTFAEYVPAETAGLTVNVMVELTTPLAGGVTWLGEMDAVTPDGRLKAWRLTAPLKLLTEPTLSVVEPDAPASMLSMLGVAATVKSGAAAGIVREKLTVWVSVPLCP